MTVTVSRKSAKKRKNIKKRKISHQSPSGQVFIHIIASDYSQANLLARSRNCYSTTHKSNKVGSCKNLQSDKAALWKASKKTIRFAQNNSGKCGNSLCLCTHIGGTGKVQTELIYLWSIGRFHCEESGFDELLIFVKTVFAHVRTCQPVAGQHNRW